MLIFPAYGRNQRIFSILFIEFPTHGQDRHTFLINKTKKINKIERKYANFGSRALIFTDYVPKQRRVLCLVWSFWLNPIFMFHYISKTIHLILMNGGLKNSFSPIECFQVTVKIGVFFWFYSIFCFHSSKNQVGFA